MRENFEKLNVTVLANSGDRKVINDQLRKWRKEM